MKKPATEFDSLILGIVVAALLGILGAVTLAFPGPKLLELENRLASAWSPPSLESVMDGEWSREVEQFLKDRFPFRTELISGACLLEEAVLGRTEQDGILIGRDGHMFTRRFSWSEEEEKQLRKNIEAISSFGKNHPGLVTAMIVPSASMIEPELLPAYAPQIGEDERFTQIIDSLAGNASVLDLREIFTKHKDRGLFYRTDHHWTTDGAMLAYETYCDSVNLKPVLPEKGSAVEVSPFLGTHYAATRLWNVKPDVLCYYPSAVTMEIYEIIGELEMVPSAPKPLINQDKLSSYDKYGAFLDGNHGFTRIRGKGTGRVLLVKDSYGNCFAPFLAESYGQVDVIDYRSYPYGLESLQEENKYDQILILYCFQSFVSDTRIVFMNRPSTR